MEISWATLWRVLLFSVFVIILFSGRQVLLGLFLAIVISSGLEVVVDFFESKGVPRTLGVVLIFLLTILILILVIYAVVPRLIVELNSIFSNLGTSTLGSIAPLSYIQSSKSFEAFVKKISAAFFSGSVSPLGFFSETLGGVGLAAAVFITAFYLSLSKDGVERFLKVVLPADYEKEGLRVYERARKRIGFWFQSQIILSVIMGVLVWAALTLLGVKSAFLLAVFAALFEIVPFVGPIISGAVAVLFALSTSTTLAIYTLIAFLGLHQFESHILVPILTRKIIGLHPVIVIVSLFIGAEALGFLGVLIAVPAAAVFEEVIGEWSSKKRAAPRLVE